MTDYTKTTNFATKDALPSGNANKIVKGTEINTEFDNIATAVATKSNTASPTFTGVVSFPDGSASDPSITNTGDTNVGLFFSAGDTLAFTAGGTSQFTMANGVIAPVTDSDVDLGTSSLYFKNAYIDSVTTTGNITIGGNLDVDGTLEFDSLSGTGTTAVTDILDQDDMSGNSATALATQQSIKAYVDAQQDTVDTLSEILALSNTTGGTDIAVSDDDKVQFRDSAIYINSSVDGQLDIVADTEIQIAATTIDINGAINASGDIVVGGTVDGRDVATDGTKLDGIEASATADQSNAEIRAAVEAATDSNVFTDADHSKLNAIEASADVTDTANVTAAGALMDSELTGIASVKALNQGVATGDSPTFVDVTATSLDISGDIDVDGTTNLDAVDIDGATQIDATVSVGVNDTGYDVKFFGDTASAFMEWDASADDLILGGAGGLIVPEGQFTLGSTAVTSTAAELNILDGATVVVGEINALDLGDTAVGTAIASKAVILDSNKDYTGIRNLTISGELDAATLDISGNADIDGTLEADAITVNGTALNTVIAGVTVTNASTAAVATTVTITDNESTNESNALIFTAGGDVDGGDLGLESDGTLTYNPSTGVVTATGFAGALTGNVTGNVSGTAATVTGAAQGNITSLGTLTSLDISGDATVGDDLSLDSDAAVLNFGANSEIKVIHAHDSGLNFKHTATADDKPFTLTLQTGETDIAADDVLGVINFQAPDEATGTDAILVAAGIAAVSEGDFSASSNATKLSFRTGASETATEKMSLSSGGNLSFPDDGKVIFGAGNDLQIYHDGNNSYIHDNGTGNLIVRADQFDVKSADAAEYKIRAITNGAVSLYHDNSVKLATTSTGIDVTGVITTDGMTTSADINFGDNDKAIFGAGSDLQIYHDGSNSYIAELGTGSLIIQASDNIKLQAHTGEFYFQGIRDGAAKLYYDNAEKLLTTSTGIDVTGTATMDGLTVANTGFARITLQDSDATNQKGFIDSSAGDLNLTSQNGTSHGDIFLKRYNGTSTALSAQFASNGDISFYEDTGSTAKFFWDSSAESLGIGTTSPARDLHIVQNDDWAQIRLEGNSSGGAEIMMGDSTTESKGRIQYVNASNYMRFDTNATERMRIDSSGNILAGTDDAQDIGSGSKRFDDIHATNGTIQTSDRNEKQDIAELSDAEQRVAVAAKGLLRKFRWKSAVVEKGDNARTHFGIVAQDLHAAFTAEGLDAGDYGMFISSTWTDEETNEEKTRMGVRYSELLAFIISAI